MNFFVKNIKLILVILLVIIFVGGVSVYATYSYFATNVSYMKGGVEISVAEALNELYKNKKETTDETKEINASGEYTLDKYYKNINVDVDNDIEYQTIDSSSYISKNNGTFYTGTISIPEGKSKIYIYSTIQSQYSAAAPTFSSDDILTQATTLLRDMGGNSGLVNTRVYMSIIETNGNNTNIKINYNLVGDPSCNYKNCGNSIIFYE